MGIQDGDYIWAFCGLVMSLSGVHLIYKLKSGKLSVINQMPNTYRPPPVNRRACLLKERYLTAFADKYL